MTGTHLLEARPGSWTAKTPIALLIYRRPDTTDRIFRQIARARPSKLLIIADGPREGEEQSCRAARAITEQVDWPCEVVRNYANENMGCKKRVASGLTWVFSHVEEAVVLEDDTVPHSSFFRYCDELLERYRNDERIMVISGDNFQTGKPRTEYSYYFSLFNHCWGWASWRRSWRYFDLDMAVWPELREGRWLDDLLTDPDAVAYWRAVFDRAHRQEIDTWDYAWTLNCWAQSGLTVLPAVNLVANVGFDARATHTKSANPRAQLAAEELTFPLSHPPFVIRDRAADSLTQRELFAPHRALTLRRRVAGAMRRLTNPVRSEHE